MTICFESEVYNTEWQGGKSGGIHWVREQQLCYFTYRSELSSICIYFLLASWEESSNLFPVENKPVWQHSENSGNKFSS